VPLKGFWKTRPTRLARRCSGHAVTSTPSIRMVPASTGNVPAMALRSVDLPDPFVPTTMTNDPSSTERSMPWSARSSFAVAALNVLKICRMSSMVRESGPDA
jgi:hypothetical protein